MTALDWADRLCEAADNAHAYGYPWYTILFERIQAYKTWRAEQPVAINPELERQKEQLE